MVMGEDTKEYRKTRNYSMKMITCLTKSNYRSKISNASFVLCQCASWRRYSKGNNQTVKKIIPQLNILIPREIVYRSR